MDFCKLSPHIRFVKIFSYYPKRPDFVMGYDYRIFYITDGSILLKFKDSEFTLEKNSFVLIPPEFPYCLEATSEKSCELLCFNFDCVRNDLSVETRHPDIESMFNNSYVFEKDRIPEFERRIVIKDASFMREKLLDIYKEFQSVQFGYREKGESSLCGLLVSCLRRTSHYGSKEINLVTSVKEYLLENMSEACDAASIGEIFHYHPNYINRVFKEREGTTIHNFLIVHRVNLAKELLATSNLTLEKISVRCGFKTSAHFSQCFKKLCGMTPSDFRKQSENIII